jgi:ATP-dependent exoDNAse (exonuclease V) alpha subunit
LSLPAVPSISYVEFVEGGEGDLIAFTSQHRRPGQPRVENGTRGEITAIHPRGVRVALDGSDRHVNLPAEDLGSIRLGYAQHVYRQQGATVQRSIVLTGGWQTQQGERLRAGHTRTPRHRLVPRT